MEQDRRNQHRSRDDKFGVAGDATASRVFDFYAAFLRDSSSYSRSAVAGSNTHNP